MAILQKSKDIVDQAKLIIFVLRFIRAEWKYDRDVGLRVE